jgi:hypothetical protein
MQWSSPVTVGAGRGLLSPLDQWEEELALCRGPITSKLFKPITGLDPSHLPPVASVDFSDNYPRNARRGVGLIALVASLQNAVQPSNLECLIVSIQRL